jgi:cell division protein FtsI/penicillin-binding protein 2
VNGAASIRTRLSAWYAGAFALLLSAFALAGYVFLEHATEERIDEYLAETAGAVAGAMEYERVSGKAFDQIVDDVLEEFRFSDMAVIVLDRATSRMSMLDLGTRPRATSPRTHAAQQLPDLRTIMTSTAEIRDALEGPVMAVVDAVKEVVDATPPELAADIMEHGVALTGGGALLRGLDQRLADEPGLPDVGRGVEGRVLATSEQEPGRNVKTTIDPDLQ